MVFMGKSYYCEYCDKKFRDELSVRRNHLNSLQHQVTYKAYYEKFKDIRTILKDETGRQTCSRILANEECRFGFHCRFSHYTPEQLNLMRMQVQHEDQQERERNKTIPIDWDAVDKWFRKIHYKYGQKRTRKRMSNIIISNSL